MSGSPISVDAIRKQGLEGTFGQRMMAIVAEGDRERVYLSPTEEHILASQVTSATWRPTQEINHNPRDIRTQLYGLTTYGDLFTNRQLAALTTFSDLLGEVIERVQAHSSASGLSADSLPLRDGGQGFTAYAEAIGIYLSFVADRMVNYSSSLCTWHNGVKYETVTSTFGRQAIPMTWDYAESNLFSDSSGGWSNGLKWTSAAIDLLRPTTKGTACQIDAASGCGGESRSRIISTDPPYYDNIGYADLSDYFYVWLRRSMREVYPGLFATLTVPKSAELVATPYRHGDKASAEEFFLSGMKKAMARISESSSLAFPLTIYYAFKQSETRSLEGTASTGWETFLEAVIGAGLMMNGTWPIRTEYTGNLKKNVGALASSVVLVCHLRPDSAQIVTRNDFRRQLRQEMPKALRQLENANIAPVDVAQAAIGPGMAIFSAAKAVLNPDDSPMSVRDALIEINAALDEHLSQDEGELDSNSRFALTFFESFGYAEREFGDAEGLAKARNLSVAGVAEAGILRTVAGRVRLLQRSELPVDWDPYSDKRLCVWEATQHLIKRLETDGEGGAATLLLQLKNLPGHGDLAANCRALAYRLYNHCEKTKQAEEARSYNGLVIAWPELERQASAASSAQSAPLQTSLI